MKIIIPKILVFICFKMKFHMGKFSLIGYPKYYCHVGAFWWGLGVCISFSFACDDDDDNYST